MKQQIKLVLRYSLCKSVLMKSVAVAQVHLQYFLTSQMTHKYMLLHVLGT